MRSINFKGYYATEEYTVIRSPDPKILLQDKTRPDTKIQKDKIYIMTISLQNFAVFSLSLMKPIIQMFALHKPPYNQTTIYKL